MAGDRGTPRYRRAGAALTMEPLRLLVLAAGTRVGQNIHATLRHRRQEIVLIATSSVVDEPGLFDYDIVHRVPASADPAFAPALAALMAAERVDLVVPCRDDDVLLLAGLRERRPDLAPRLLCGNAACAAVIVDKAESFAFCAAHDLPFAPTLCAPASGGARRAFVRATGFPLIVKPRRGYASMGVLLVWNDAQLARALARDDAVAQRFLGDTDAAARFLADAKRDGLPLFHTFQGLKHSIQALIRPEGTPGPVICTRNLSDRRRSKVVRPDDDDDARAIGTRCAAAFAAAGWRGPLNIQCQKDAAGRLLIHEFNGRFTGGTIERWQLGFDEVGIAIAAFTGRTLAPSPIAPATAPREIFETVVARGADPRDVETLRRDGVWRRAT